MKAKAKPQSEDLHTQEEQLNLEMASFFKVEVSSYTASSRHKICIFLFDA